MPPDQYDLDKEGEFGLCGVAVALETEAIEHPRLLHISNHLRHFESLDLLSSDRLDEGGARLLSSDGTPSAAS